MNQKGFILITSYLLITMLAIFSLALFSRGKVFIDNSERYKNRIAAFHMAESGVDMAITQLAINPNYVGTTGFVSMNGTNLQAGYSLVVCPPTCTGLTQPADSSVRLIRSVGAAPGNDTSLPGYQSKTITTYLQLGSSNSFDFAVFAKNSIQMSGNAQTDSYDSRIGPYNASNPGSNGDLGTDTTAAHFVMMSGNVKINGDAVVGPSGNPNSVIIMSGNSSITGTKSAASAAKNYQAKTTSASSEGALSISGNTNYFLPAGTHRFSSLSVTGNGKITALGPVQIYVDGAVNISGNGIATQSDSPPNMLIYVTGNSSVGISGNGNFYGGIYAPLSSVANTGNGGIFGALISKNYQQSGNGKVHFDKALKTGGACGSGATLKSWQETSY